MNHPGDFSIQPKTLPSYRDKLCLRFPLLLDVVVVRALKFVSFERSRRGPLRRLFAVLMLDIPYRWQGRFERPQRCIPVQRARLFEPRRDRRQDCQQRDLQRIEISRSVRTDQGYRRPAWRVLLEWVTCLQRQPRRATGLLGFQARNAPMDFLSAIFPISENKKRHLLLWPKTVWNRW